MKNLITIALGALLGTSALSADYHAVSLATTNSLTASATQTTGTGNVIDLKNYTRLGLQVEFIHTADAAVAAANCTITLIRSADGVTYETTPTLTWVIPNNSTNQVVAFTNLPAANTDTVRYIKVKSLQNGSTNAMSDFKIWAIRKTATP